MSKTAKKPNQLQVFWAKVEPGLGKTGKVLKTIGIWLYRLRGVFMAIPVALAAWKLADYNMEHLPEMVGWDIQSSGEFAMMIERDVAVYGPLAVTAACLLLMLFSRRAFYPWVISIFTLILPVLILVTNMFQS